MLNVADSCILLWRGVEGLGDGLFEGSLGKRARRNDALQ